MDGDGDIDVFNIGVLYNPQSVLYINDGQGVFEADTSQTFIYGFQCDAEFIDIENDGDLDLLIAGGQTGGSSIRNALFINDGSGQFTYSTNFETQIPQTNSYYGKLEVGDLNNDGFSDFILVNQISSYKDSTQVFLNDGVGNFQFEPSGINSDISGYFDQIRLIDYNGDDYLDYSSVRRDSTLIINLNNGLGNFTQTTPAVFDTLKTLRITYDHLNNDS